MALSPRDPHLFFVEHALMTAHFFSHHLEEADMLSELVLERNTNHASALNVRLAILGHLARHDEARKCLAMLRRIDPEVTIERIVGQGAAQAGRTGPSTSMVCAGRACRADLNGGAISSDPPQGRHGLPDTTCACAQIAYAPWRTAWSGCGSSTFPGDPNRKGRAPNGSRQTNEPSVSSR